MSRTDKSIETKIAHASRPKNQNIKQEQYCNKFYKDFLRNGPHQKKSLKKKKENVLELGRIR